jgi:superfamily II DNA or RNA helicase
MRRLTSKRDRTALWLQQDGKCAICQTELEEGWHADHIVPYRIVKETKIQNMQALCPACNLQKSDKYEKQETDIMTNKQIYEEGNEAKFSDVSGMRIGQRGALNCIISRIRNGEKKTAIVLPTRYGKSDVIRLSAYELYYQGLVSTSVVMVPSAFLYNQMVRRADVKQMISRYHVQNDIESARLNSQSQERLMKAPKVFMAATIQWVNMNCANMVKYVRAMIRRTGKPPAFYIDESHMNSSDNSWGTTIEKIEQAGAYIILVTGTPYRADGKLIPGFDVEEIDAKDSQVTVTRPVPGKEGFRQVTVYKQQVKDVILTPHYQRTYREAWDEGVICRINRISFDPTVTASDRTRQNLSDINSETDARRALGQVVRTDQCIEEGIRLLVEHIQYKKQHFNQKHISGLIFVGNDVSDFEDYDAQHINRVASILRNRFPEIRFGIATSADEEAAEKTITEFGKGSFDVLIVKQMASVGLDVSHLKVALDLSTVRTKAAFIQRIMRTATRFGNVNYGDYITPDDNAGLALFQTLITNEGGSEQTLKIRGDVIDDKEVESGDQGDEVKQFIVDDIQAGTFSDDEAKKASTKEAEYRDAYVQKYPDAAVLSYASIIEKAKDLWPDGPPKTTREAKYIDEAAELKKLTSDRTDRARRIGGFRARRNRTDIGSEVAGAHYEARQLSRRLLGYSWSDKLSIQEKKAIIQIYDELLRAEVMWGNDDSWDDDDAMEA